LRSQIGISTLRFAASDTPIAILDATVA